MENWPLALLGCLVPLVLLALLTVLAARRKKPRPTAPLPAAQPPPRTGLTAYLESASLSGEPCRLSLDPAGTTVGRAEDNDLVITTDFPAWESASRHHARIVRHNEQWIVEDLGSKNGVYVNGQRTGRNLLREGWRVGLGQVEFVFHAGPGEVQS